MDFIPNTQQEKEQMLREIGAARFDELLGDIPEELLLKDGLSLPPPVSEFEVKARLKKLSEKNASSDRWICFVGGGAYDHYVPSIVDRIASREEFYTAYTPYQPEISQGTLQTIYEYQSLMTRLTGMEISNASLYDGGTALAEAVLMASAINGKKEVILSGCINPLRLSVLRTYLRAAGFDIKLTGGEQGWTDPDEIGSLASGKTCCVILENPNFFGVVEGGSAIGDVAKSSGALFIVSVDPISLGILAAPAAYGADIVVGEGQSLGNRLNFGGPYLGFMATKKEFIRKLPGRIVGKTVDKEGRPCFCLTLQTREQHIRRERATSNICTNQALIALRAAIYLCWLGKEGIRELARMCLSKAMYAHKAFTANGFDFPFERPFFREFVIDLTVRADKVLEALLDNEILGGISLGKFYPDKRNWLLVSFTEKRTREEIDRLVLSMSRVKDSVEASR